MEIGFIGAGSVARAIAAHALRAGHGVLLSNSRGPETLRQVVDALGPDARAVSPAMAAEADVVFLAVPWPQVEPALAALPRGRDGRILVDTTNQFIRVRPQLVVERSGVQTASEWVQSLVPGTRVVKAFNAMYGRYIAADPVHDAGRQVLFYAGDDVEAKSVFHHLAAGFGFAPVDLGPLRDGGRLLQVDGGPLSGLHALQQVGTSPAPAPAEARQRSIPSLA